MVLGVFLPDRRQSRWWGSDGVGESDVPGRATMDSRLRGNDEVGGVTDGAGMTSRVGWEKIWEKRRGKKT
jgi:hypothetical protein